MKQLILLLCVLTVAAGPLAGAEILQIDPSLLLPSTYTNLLDNALRLQQQDAAYNALLRMLESWRYRLPGREVWESRFHLIPHDKLLIPFPSDIISPPQGIELPGFDNLFADRDLRFNDDAYQTMRWDDYLKPVDPGKTGTTPGQTSTTSGWRWDITEDIRLVLRGAQQIEASYGFDVVNQNLMEGTYIRRVGVTRGFRLSQNLNIDLLGQVGKKIKIQINHNSQRKDNLYEISYTGRPNEVVKQIKAGNIDLTVPNSKYVVYSGGSKSAFGLKGVLGTQKFKMEAVLSLTKGISETKTFRGQQSEQTILIRDTAYVKGRYYTLPHSGIDAASIRVYRTTTVTNNGIMIGGGVYSLLVGGTDYIHSSQSGKLDLARVATRDQNILVAYTVGGAAPDMTGHDYVEEGATRYLVLKSVVSPSRYERKGIYNLGYRNIDTTRGFEFYIVNTADGVRSEAVQFASGQYRLDTGSGLLEFTERLPFQGKPLIPDILYNSVNEPSSTDSVYSLKFVFLYKVDSFQLRFNILPGSERVLINNVLKTRDTDYRIDYMIGVITFITPINENDTIQVSYEYKPFSSSLQRTLLGVRTDFKPVRGVNLGGTLMYSGGQKPTGAPAVGAAPNSSLIFDLDMTLDLLELFGIKTTTWKARMSGEFAYSINDNNTVGKALFADMEADAIGFAITRTEDLWMLGSPSPVINGGLAHVDRGRLYYRDYRKYELTGSFTLESYYWGIPSSQILTYARKPGPYMVKGGRNESTSEIAENSLVLEYDFSGGKQWVSVVSSIAGSGGMNLSKINKLLLSLKHQAFTSVDGNGNALYSDTGSGEVKIYFELGTINEDADGDGNFDYEATLTSGGYAFNPAGADSTWIGGGRKETGNGRQDSEDLNRDSLFQTSEQSILFPDTGLTGSDTLLIPAGTGWQEHTLQIQNLTPAQLSLLERVTAVRITVVRSSGDRGRLLIDKAYFKGSLWDVLVVDGNQTKTSPEFSASVITTRENSEYKENRIYKEWGGLFEDLHGRLSKSEEDRLDEKALRLQYNLSVTNSQATVTKIFNSNLDFTSYKKLTLFLFVREKATHTNQRFVLRLGNAPDRYYEWKVPLGGISTAAEATAAGTKKWHKVDVLLNPDDGSKKFHIMVDDTDYGPAVTTPKQPNLREINRSTLGIDSRDALEPTPGELWVNEAHLSDDELKKGAAFSFRGEVSSTEKNLFSLFGVPVLGPFSLTWDLSRVNLGFSSIGQDNTDWANGDFSAAGGITLLHYFNYSFQYASQTRESATDVNVLPLHLQSANTNRSFKHSFSYKDPRGLFPNMIHSYSRNIYQGLSHRVDTTDASATNDFLVDSLKQQYSESASLTLSGTLPFGITHSYVLSDSFFLTDISDMTNSVADSWFTNTTTQGYATYKKTATYTVGLALPRIFGTPGSALNVSASVFKEAERFDRVNSPAGMRQRFSELEGRAMLDSYGDRLEELLSGIGSVSTAIDGTNMSMVSKGLAWKAAASQLGPVSLSYGFTRANRDSNFIVATNAAGFQKNNATTAKSEITLGLTLPKFAIQSLSLGLTREFSFTQAYGTDDMDGIWDTFRGGFFKLPFHYLGSRDRDIAYVKNLADSEGQDTVSLRNTMSLSGKLLFPEGILRDLLPDYYNYTLAQATMRQLSSYSQNRAWTFTFGKSIPLKKLGFWIFNEKSRPGKQVQDLVFKMTLGTKYDYNTKIITDSIASGLAFSIRWDVNTSFVLSYDLTHSSERQSLFSTDKDYVYMGLGKDTGDGQGDSFGDMEETAGGLPPLVTEYPDKSLYSHTIKLDIFFPTKHRSEWKILGIKIPIDPLWVHKNEFSLTLYDTEYGRSRSGSYTFTEIFDRTFLLRLGHSINYDFSKSWNMILYFLFVFEQWRLVTPEAGLLSLKEERFPVSFGMQFGLKMQIRF